MTDDAAGLARYAIAAAASFGRDPAHRLAGLQAVALGGGIDRLVEQPADPRGVGGAGVDAVDPDALAELVAAIASVSESTAPLVAEYRARCGTPRSDDRADVDDRGVLGAAQERQGGAGGRTIPTTLTSNTRCHSSSGLSATVPIVADARVVDQDVDAAEAVRRLLDRRPHRRVVGDIGLEPGELVAGVESRAPPTRAPRAASSRAVACPIPEPPPVTIAASPLSSVPFTAAGFSVM